MGPRNLGCTPDGASCVGQKQTPGCRSCTGGQLRSHPDGRSGSLCVTDSRGSPPLLSSLLAGELDHFGEAANLVKEIRVAYELFASIRATNGIGEPQEVFNPRRHVDEAQCFGYDSASQ